MVEAVIAGIPRTETSARSTEAVAAQPDHAPVAQSRAPRRLRYVGARAAAVLLGIVVVTYGAMAVAPLVAVQLLDLPNLLLSLSARGFVWFVQALDSGLDLWMILGRAGRAIGAAVAQPGVTLAFIGFELVALVALYGLHRLLRINKE